jgi:branched-chain amino acid transport system permease protein
MTYALHLLVLLELYLLVAASLNLLIGYAGLLQVAHAAYYGVGAYAATLLTMKLGIGFVPAAVCGGLAAALLSLLVSLPAWRFRGDAFVLMSLSVQVALFAVFYNWVDLTGGPFGLSAIPKPAIFGIVLATQSSICATYGLMVTLCVGVLALLKWSPFGRSLQAVRDDELAARSLGIPARRLKIQAFAIASALVGVAGAMYAAYATYIDPTSFSLDESILMLSMVIVGGTGNVRGPLVGALTLIAIPEVLRFAALPDAVAANVRLLVYGLLIVVLMRLRPQGLAGRYRFE